MPTLLTLMSLTDSAFGVSTYGQDVTFTASVTSSSITVNTGTVGFYQSGTLLTVALVISGQASFTTGFPAGSHPIIAVYSDGLGIFAPSSARDTLTVNPAPLIITPLSQSIIYGQAVPSFTLFQSDGFVNGDTAASLTTQPTFTTDAANFGNAVGSYPIVGSGASDPNYTISYINGTLTITPDSTITAISATASSLAFGQSVGINAVVTPLNSSVSTLTGSVEFFDGGTLLTTGALGAGDIAGATGFTTSNLSPGVHALTAVYPGDANHTGGTSSPVSVTVGAPPPSGVISGAIFHDYNGNGVQDPGEPALPSHTVFLDLDGSGQLKTGDPTAITDGNGNYQFTGLDAGTYTVREVLLGGVLLSAPASGSFQVTLTGASVTGENFAEVLTSIGVPLALPARRPFPVQGNANADYVEAVYRAVLGRDADAGGLANWTSLLNSGSLSRLQVVQGIRNSAEQFTQEVTDFYLVLLGRAPDPAGLQNWVQHLEAGMKEERVAFYFLDSPEYLSQGDKHFVDALYTSLLGRTLDAAGEASWLYALGDDTSGNPTHAATLTHEQEITDFLYSQESLTRLTEGYYETFLQRTADSGGLSGWVGQLEQGLSFLTIGQQFLASDEYYNRAAAQG